MPRSTVAALDELADPALSGRVVGLALDVWDGYTRIPRAERRWEKDPSDEDRGEWARTTLDAALAALPEREARPLRRAVARLDERFLATTVPDPSVGADRYWWQRRDWFCPRATSAA